MDRRLMFMEKITLLGLSDKFIDTYPIFQVRVYRTGGRKKSHRKKVTEKKSRKKSHRK